MDNTESISAKLRRWADEGESDNRRHFYPTLNACDDFGIRIADNVFVSERELFHRIADEVDAEKDRILRNCAYDLSRLVGKTAENGESFESWLDRYYLPRPLFEDGEPVQLGDTVVDKLRGEMLVTRMCHVGKGVYFNESHNPWGKKLRKTRIAYAPGERVERPEPKVLDADGVPIEVGDTVWVDETEHVDCPWEVVFIHNAGYAIVHQCFGGEREIAVSPSKITHREPDTQERIDDDVTMPPRSYYAKHIGHDVGLKDDEEVWTAVTAHLLRRQRELDARKGGAE